MYILISASEKRAFLLYYAVPLLSSYLPPDLLFFLMMLTGGLFRLLKQSIVVFHSKSYKRVVARNDYTVEFQHLQTSCYGSIHTYVKVEEKCLKAKCSEQKCSCDLICHHFAIIEVFERDHQQLPEYRGWTVVKHITRVKTSNRY